MLRLVTSLGRLPRSSPFPQTFTVQSAVSFARHLSSAPEVARVYYENEKPRMSIHLPSKGVTTLQLPSDRPLGCLIQEIKEEDPEVKKVEVIDSKGFRTSGSSLIGLVLGPGSKLMLNDVAYQVEHPSLEERIKPKQDQLAELKQSVEPFEITKEFLDKKAVKFTNRLVWTGFVALCAQWGVMMRLTWYEYSWDVMEPIAYFLSFGTGILGYSFYVVTRRDYTYEALEGHTVTRRQLALYKRNKFDYVHYYNLKDTIRQVEEDIEKLKLQHQS